MRQYMSIRLDFADLMQMATVEWTLVDSSKLPKVGTWLNPKRGSTRLQYTFLPTPARLLPNYILIEIIVDKTLILPATSSQAMTSLPTLLLQKLLRSHPHRNLIQDNLFPKEV